jgi:hypothetical protein
VKPSSLERVVFLSALATLGALCLMVLSIVAPKPILLVMAMSIGQGVGTLSLALYLLAIALDLQRSNAGEQPPAAGEPPGTAPSGEAASGEAAPPPR